MLHVSTRCPTLGGRILRSPEGYCRASTRKDWSMAQEVGLDQASAIKDMRDSHPSRHQAWCSCQAAVLAQQVSVQIVIREIRLGFQLLSVVASLCNERAYERKTT